VNFSLGVVDLTAHLPHLTSFKEKAEVYGKWPDELLLTKTLASAAEPAREFALRFSSSMRKKANRK
jgi:hypothetical protein